MSNPHPRPRLSPEVSRQVIEALGGHSAIAKLCGISNEAVIKWKRYGINKPRMLYLQERYRSHPIMKLPEVILFCGG